MLFVFLLACTGAAKDDTGDDGADDRLAVSIPFAPTVGGAPFACGTSYEGVGASAATVSFLDLRMYVHDVALLDAGGARVPVALDADGAWQSAEVALLDFEDGSGDCETGSTATHPAVTGTVPAGTYAGLSFVLGVPSELNHLDAATAEPPLNETALWWSWSAGYKFARIDLRSEGASSWLFHLGSTGCTGSADAYSCSEENTVEVELDGFDPATDTVRFDLAELFVNADLDQETVGSEDTVPGCMSSQTDPQCGPLFEVLGLRWGGAVPTTQTLFKR